MGFLPNSKAAKGSVLFTDAEMDKPNARRRSISQPKTRGNYVKNMKLNAIENTNVAISPEMMKTMHSSPYVDYPANNNLIYKKHSVGFKEVDKKFLPSPPRLSPNCSPHGYGLSPLKRINSSNKQANLSSHCASNGKILSRVMEKEMEDSENESTLKKRLHWDTNVTARTKSDMDSEFEFEREEERNTNNVHNEFESNYHNWMNESIEEDNDTGIKVIVRIRPMNGREIQNGSENVVFRNSRSSLALNKQTYTFDSVASQESTQHDMFEMVGKSIVENCLAGFNSSIFAYGQTGSGKTFTMLGNNFNTENLPPSENRGLIPRVFELLFLRINQEQELNKDKQIQYTCKCSFLEIYNEQITDLLDPTQKNLQIREDVKRGVYVESLTEERVNTLDDIFRLLQIGIASRKVGVTAMNSESSRSHSVFTCVIESRYKDIDHGVSACRFSRLNLVDLAGSERQKLTGAAGDRLKEAGSINKSLSQLGNVIKLLAEVAQTGKPRHIPYRDSRLTFLLQESLGGNAKTVMICNISPSNCNSNETLSTLKFAQRAKAVKNKAVVNEETNSDVNELKQQIRILKAELSRMKLMITPTPPKTNNTQISHYNKNDNFQNSPSPIQKISTADNGTASEVNYKVNKNDKLEEIRKEEKRKSNSNHRYDDDKDNDVSDCESDNSISTAREREDSEIQSNIAALSENLSCGNNYEETVEKDKKCVSEKDKMKFSFNYKELNVQKQINFDDDDDDNNNDNDDDGDDNKDDKENVDICQTPIKDAISPIDFSIDDLKSLSSNYKYGQKNSKNYKSPSSIVVEKLRKSLSVLDKNEKKSHVSSKALWRSATCHVSPWTFSNHSEIFSPRPNDFTVRKLNLNDVSGSKMDVDAWNSNHPLNEVILSALRRERNTNLHSQKLEDQIRDLEKIIRKYKQERESQLILQQNRNEHIIRLEHFAENIITPETFLAHEWSSMLYQKKIMEQQLENHPELLHAKMEKEKLNNEIQNFKNIIQGENRESLLKENLILKQYLLQMLESKGMNININSMILNHSTFHVSALSPSRLAARSYGTATPSDGNHRPVRTNSAYRDRPTNYVSPPGTAFSQKSYVASCGNKSYEDRMEEDNDNDDDGAYYNNNSVKKIHRSLKKEVLNSVMEEKESVGEEDEVQSKEESEKRKNKNEKENDSMEKYGDEKERTRREWDEQGKEWRLAFEKREEELIHSIEGLREENMALYDEVCRVKEELEEERSECEEAKNALQCSFQGNARLLEEYDELQERHIALLSKQRQIMEGVEEMKEKAKKNKFLTLKTIDSKWINAILADSMKQRIEKEREERESAVQITELKKMVAENALVLSDLQKKEKENEEVVEISKHAAASAEFKACEIKREMENIKRKFAAETEKYLNLIQKASSSPLCPACSVSSAELKSENEHFRESFSKMEAKHYEPRDGEKKLHNSSERVLQSMQTNTLTPPPPSRGGTGLWDLGSENQSQLQNGMKNLNQSQAECQNHPPVVDQGRTFASFFSSRFYRPNPAADASI